MSMEGQFVHEISQIVSELQTDRLELLARWLFEAIRPDAESLKNPDAFTKLNIRKSEISGETCDRFYLKVCRDVAKDLLNKGKIPVDIGFSLNENGQYYAAMFTFKF